MCKILGLASIEMGTENSEDISIILGLFNEVCAKVTEKQGYKFNPRALVCDEGGANFKTIKKVYGEEFVKDCIFGCQWQFTSDAQSKANELLPDHMPHSSWIYVRRCSNIQLSVSKYNILKGMLGEMAKEPPILKPWIAWWHARRSHTFVPFRADGLPAVQFV